MSEKLGPLQFGSSGGGQVFLGRDLQNEPNYSDKIAYEIDLEIQNIINTCYERAKEIITKHKEQLELIAQTLLEVETLMQTKSMASSITENFLSQKKRVSKSN